MSKRDIKQVCGLNGWSIKLLFVLGLFQTVHKMLLKVNKYVNILEKRKNKGIMVIVQAFKEWD